MGLRIVAVVGKPYIDIAILMAEHGPAARIDIAIQQVRVIELKI